MKKFMPAVIAAAVVFSCAVSVQARGQRMVTLPPGLHRLDIAALEARLGTFEAVAVTIPPPRWRAVLYLDGSPVEGYRMLNRAQLERVWIFVPEGAPASAAMLPFTPSYGGAAGITGLPRGTSSAVKAQASPKVGGERRPRIRCINPVFTVNNRTK